MTSTPHQLARMSSDEPRGYGAVGDARKRLHPQHQEHHDPAVCTLLAGARAVTLTDCADTLRAAIETRGGSGLAERDAGYVDGWNAAAGYFAAAFRLAATEIREQL